MIEAAPRRDGTPNWLIQDPVCNRFYRLGWLEFELIARWGVGPAAEVIEQTRADTGLVVEPIELAELVDFLGRHHLLRASEPAATRALIDEAARRRAARWQRLLHDYLFFRLPLVRPGAWLERWLPRVRPLGSPPVLVVVALVGLIGLGLAARQWDVFLASLDASLSWQGLVGYAIALAVAKALHELGHAFTATRYGVEVAHMGVAFIVLWPMLYTDTGESWRLVDRRQRFRIAAAGIGVELGLAAVATLGWSLVADGPLRDALFFLATVSWLMTIAINASPFMRFDGYFLLSDALDMPNLHQRAFAQAKAALRRAVLGVGSVLSPGSEPVEAFDRWPRRALIGFAWLTWAWRFAVFIGIAVAVYQFSFKLLGILLFAIEIGWFLVRPVATELGHWVALRHRAQRGHVVRSVLGLIAIVAVLALPWRGTVGAEAVLHAEHQLTVQAPVAARLVEPIVGGDKAAGSRLVVLDSPDLDQRAHQHRVAADGLERQLRLSIGSPQARERRSLIAERLQAELTAFAGERAQLARLELTAPFAGRLVDIDPTLKPGGWVAAGQPLAVLEDPRSWLVDAYLDSRDVGRIRIGAGARFHRHGDPSAPLEGRVEAIDADRQQAFAHPMLAVDHGGRLPAVRGRDGVLAPRDALYRVRIRIDAAPVMAAARADSGAAGARRPWQEAPGTVRIDAEPRSLLLDWGRQALSVLIRESGF